MQPEPSSSLGACTSLQDHTFAAVQSCSGGNSGPASADNPPLTFFGPLYLTKETLSAYYLNAICEWDLESGQAERLLAPQLSGPYAYARSGKFTVNAQCDATLNVYSDGCLTAQLSGHRVVDKTPQPVANLDPIHDVIATAENRIASLGADNTVRFWDLLEQRELASKKLPGAPDQRWRMHLDQTSQELILTALNGTQLLELDANTLDEKNLIEDVAPTIDGWQRLSRTRFVGNSPERKTLVIDEQGQVSTQFPTRRPPTALAVSDAGAVAIGDLTRVLLLPPGAEETRQPTVLASSLSQVTALRFSADGSVLYVCASAGDLVAIDVDTGQTRQHFRPPN